MPVEITLDFHDETVRIELQKLTAEIQLAIRRALIKATLLVETKAKLDTPVDTGRLRDSIVSKVDGLMGSVGSSVEYAEFVEYRTRPHFPPPQALEGWAGRVLGDKGLAFIVARGISLHGTKAQPYLIPALEHSSEAISDIFFKELSIGVQKV